MDLKNILSQVEQVDPEVYEKLSPRRHILKSFGSKVAVAALPFALGAYFKKAYGKTTDTASLVAVLNFALTLEYLEFNFYHDATASGVVALQSTYANDFVTIQSHEKEHVDFLRTTINSLSAGAAYQPPTGFNASDDTAAGTYDFTGHNTFPDVFSNYDTFLAVSQVFEDTGVRAYKGQAGNLMENDGLLTAALQIHSMEARHASHIRMLRRKRGATTVKPWITGSDAGISGTSAQAAAIAGSYNGATPESNTSQGNPAVMITTLPGYTGTVSVNAATESFDEPLTMSEVVAQVTPFFA